MINPENERRHPRLNFAVQVEIKTADQTLIASSRDICMRGLFIGGVDPLPMDTTCDVAIELESGHNRLVIKARGKVVRQVEGIVPEAKGMGVEFTDMETVHQERLWRVIHYNTLPESSE
jgi:c-di-GMP-binding flagellar brake protein YcgR